MRVIYEPKGRAKEYSELACNWYMGCTHGCKYCFAPGCMRKKMEDWHKNVTLRDNILHLFRKDAEDMYENKDTRPILFSFLSDPYQPIEEKYKITTKVYIPQVITLSYEFVTENTKKYSAGRPILRVPSIHPLSVSSSQHFLIISKRVETTSAASSTFRTSRTLNILSSTAPQRTS